MLTGPIRTQVDQVWNAFWAGGISNPIQVIEQITYLLFLRRLDDLHTLEEEKAATLKKPIERRIFPEGEDPKGRPYEELRWSRFKNMLPADMFEVVDQHVFPFVRTLAGDDSTYAHHMKDARYGTRLYESPFTDVAPQGPQALFGRSDVDRLVKALAKVRESATAA